MKLVIVSDTHCQMSKVKLPDGDLLIHCGDVSNRGSILEITEFNYDLQFVKNRYKHGILMIPGNHDWLFEHSPALAKEIMTNATVLLHEAIEIEGIKFFGSPHTPRFFDWAFNVDRGEPIAQLWKDIPDDTRVLITHGPPYDRLDVIRNEKVGCEELRKTIDERLKALKLHCFGHIHFSHGQMEVDGIKYVNAATCNEKYRTSNQPITVEI